MTRLLIDSVVDYAIFVLDPRGFVRTWNPGAQRLKGYEQEEIVGRHFSTFYTEDARAAGLPDTLLVRAEREGSVQHSGPRVRKDGTTFWGNVTITALRDHGELVGFAKVTRDLTDVHEHEEALARALARERATAAELEQLHRARTRFVAGVVHDLSAPITIVRSSLELLAGQLEDAEVDDEITAELVDTARRNADDLEALRVQLQEFARLEGGSVSLALATVDLNKLVSTVVEDLSAITGPSRVEVDVDPALQVVADDLALRRIVTNLVLNAARYTPPERPIRVVTGPAPTPDRVAVGVRDEGPGIRVEDQKRVFQEFWSGRGGTRPGGGLGLGLNIVDRYVTEHSGQVWIDSTEGHGATFWFSLERAVPPDEVPR